jgi:hypothetical protein
VLLAPPLHYPTPVCVSLCFHDCACICKNVSSFCSATKSSLSFTLPCKAFDKFDPNCRGLSVAVQSLYSEMTIHNKTREQKSSCLTLIHLGIHKK